MRGPVLPRSSHDTIVAHSRRVRALSYGHWQRWDSLMAIDDSADDEWAQKLKISRQTAAPIRNPTSSAMPK